MVPGIIKIEGIDGVPYYINPLGITLISHSTPNTMELLGGRPEHAVKGASVIVLNGLPLHIKGHPQEVLKALTNLRKKGEEHILELKKAFDKPDWMGDDEEYSTE